MEMIHEEMRRREMEQSEARKSEIWQLNKEKFEVEERINELRKQEKARDNATTETKETHPVPKAKTQPKKADGWAVPEQVTKERSSTDGDWTAWKPKPNDWGDPDNQCAMKKHDEADLPPSGEERTRAFVENGFREPRTQPEVEAMNYYVELVSTNADQKRIDAQWRVLDSMGMIPKDYLDLNREQKAKVWGPQSYQSHPEHDATMTDKQQQPASQQWQSSQAQQNPIPQQQPTPQQSPTTNREEHKTFTPRQQCSTQQQQPVYQQWQSSQAQQPVYQQWQSNQAQQPVYQQWQSSQVQQHSNPQQQPTLQQTHSYPPQQHPVQQQQYTTQYHANQHSVQQQQYTAQYHANQQSVQQQQYTAPYHANQHPVQQQQHTAPHHANQPYPDWQQQYAVPSQQTSGQQSFSWQNQVPQQQYSPPNQTSQQTIEESAYDAMRRQEESQGHRQSMVHEDIPEMLDYAEVDWKTGGGFRTFVKFPGVVDKKGLFVDSVHDTISSRTHVVHLPIKEIQRMAFDDQLELLTVFWKTRDPERERRTQEM